MMNSDSLVHIAEVSSTEIHGASEPVPTCIPRTVTIQPRWRSLKRSVNFATYLRQKIGRSLSDEVAIVESNLEPQCLLQLIKHRQKRSKSGVWHLQFVSLKYVPPDQWKSFITTLWQVLERSDPSWQRAQHPYVCFHYRSWLTQKLEMLIDPVDLSGHWSSVVPDRIERAIELALWQQQFTSLVCTKQVYSRPLDKLEQASNSHSPRPRNYLKIAAQVFAIKLAILGAVFGAGWFLHQVNTPAALSSRDADILWKLNHQAETHNLKP